MLPWLYKKIGAWGGDPFWFKKNEKNTGLDNPAENYNSLVVGDIKKKPIKRTSKGMPFLTLKLSYSKQLKDSWKINNRRTPDQKIQTKSSYYLEQKVSRLDKLVFVC